jgi:hypothetical protein
MRRFYQRGNFFDKGKKYSRQVTFVPSNLPGNFWHDQNRYSQSASLRLSPYCHFVAFQQEFKLLLKQKSPNPPLKKRETFLIRLNQSGYILGVLLR